MICTFFRNNLFDNQFDNQIIFESKISIRINLLTAIFGGEGVLILAVQTSPMLSIYNIYIKVLQNALVLCHPTKSN